MTTVSEALLTAKVAEDLWVGPATQVARTPWQRAYRLGLLGIDVIAVALGVVLVAATGLVAEELFAMLIGAPIVLAALVIATPDRRTMPTLLDDLRAAGRAVVVLAAAGGFFALLTESPRTA